MPQSEFLRLERIQVDRLFGIYDHKINLNLQERVTLLHGANGVGKTIVLRMVDAMLKARFAFFRTIPFARFLMEFHDGSTLVLTAGDPSNEEAGRYRLTLLKDGTELHSETLHLGVSEAAFIAERMGFLRPHDADTWIDIRDDELLSSSEVISRYGGPSQAREYHDRHDIPWFNSFRKNANAHLIEEQRLVRIDWGSEGPRFVGRRRVPSTIATVIKRSQDFRRFLDGTMAQYGRRSQTLDQAFPQRLISSTDSLTEDELQERMAALDEKTTELISLGILEESPTPPFQVDNLKNIDATRAHVMILVMTLYVQNTEEKLQALEDLASRTRLLFENVNQKFRHKRIRLDREKGFVAASDMSPIPLNSLSSGEQHELVLHYDLLFRVPANTIVLIDEPELSLHVTWQKRFLPDLLSIVELRGFDALVATHSPYIVGDKTELMVGLGDSD